MIRHVVLFQFKPGTSADAIGELLNEAAGLQAMIPAIVEVMHGENFSERSRGYTHVVSMGFADRSALASFYDHPAHKALKADVIDPISETMVVIDYPESTTPSAMPDNGAHDRAS